ncbi:uncharacterized protein BDZ83DRAFT_658549 [Colletotrichum acutatum]|uniref:Uncharacterized protein n=1 Tax=Glomerella acutata TaxID=27357 RepID=A0AAD8X7P5_GLOAC|nr:uncharacterized protein BDZ83DRAFT_658549 [Colletotrichum acutatum]KAK1701942.1 hypothetical protein BDZ83DRAFT_658549 [Colletotrichum acutatum]
MFAPAPQPTTLTMSITRSVEYCHRLRQLAADQLRAVTEYTIRGRMGPEQELALQSEILRIAANIQRMMPPLVGQEGEDRIASDQAGLSLLQASDDTASLRGTSGERLSVSDDTTCHATSWGVPFVKRFPDVHILTMSYIVYNSMLVCATRS